MNKTFDTTSITTKKVSLGAYTTLVHTYINGSYKKTEIIRDFSNWNQHNSSYPKEVVTLLAENTLELQALIELLQGGIEV